MSPMKLTLVKPVCKRRGCELQGQQHPKCKGHKRNGDPCGQPTMRGQFVCKMHGGKTKEALDNGERREALGEAMTAIQQIVRAGNNISEQDMMMSPDAILLYQMQKSYRVSIAYAEVIGSLEEIPITIRTMAQGEQLSAIVKAWTEERKLSAHLAKLAIDAGISRRRVEIMEQEAGMIVSLFMSMIMDRRLSLSADQIIEAKVVVAEKMRTLGTGNEVQQ